MKKLLLSVCVALLSYSFTFSQESTFNLDDRVINIGLGIGSTFYTGRYYKMTFPPVSVSFEKGVFDGVLEKGVIGIGGYLGYSGYKYEVMDWGWNYNTVVFGGRGSFHYPLIDEFDTYTGIMIGYRLVSSRQFGTHGSGINLSAAGSHILWSWYAGARYYFSNNLALMGEIGYGITYLNLGVAFKL